MVEANNFIEQIINEELEAGKVTCVQTRFPPEPNGYLHIGHAKSMYVNFGTAERYGGKCNLFFDDTNPSKEKTEFVEAIRADIRWMGYRWEKEVYASDFFDVIYEYAVRLIREGKAFVCDLSADEIRETRGTLTEKRCGRGNTRTGKSASAPRSTWRRPTSTCAIPSSIASCTRRITARGISGASIPCTTSRIPFAITCRG